MSQFISYPCLLILIYKWASILLSTCLLFFEWAFVPTVDSLFSTLRIGLYKENILSHNYLGISTSYSHATSFP